MASSGRTSRRGPRRPNRRSEVFRRTAAPRWSVRPDRRYRACAGRCRTCRSRPVSMARGRACRAAAMRTGLPARRTTSTDASLRARASAARRACPNQPVWQERWEWGQARVPSRLCERQACLRCGRRSAPEVRALGRARCWPGRPARMGSPRRVPLATARMAFVACEKSLISVRGDMSRVPCSGGLSRAIVRDWPRL